MTDEDMWFVIHEGKLLLHRDGDALQVPRYTHLKSHFNTLTQAHYFGTQDGCPCHMAGLETNNAAFGEDFEVKGLFGLMGLFNEDLILTAACAAQLVRWNKSHTYCGRCGQPMSDKTDERAKECRDCNLISYPRLSPAVIVAVVKDGKLLLARSTRSPTGFFSVLAGFVEPGETLEECVVREVFEEVGIWVKNVQYFGSQLWPFPDSLMLGFTAEYSHGEITLNPSEIADAGWFTADNLPNIPPKISIARRLIDWYLEI